GEGALGIQIELIEVHRVAHAVGCRGALAHDFAPLHFQFAHTSARPRIVDRDLPNARLWRAVMTAHFDDMIENILTIALAAPPTTHVRAVPAHRLPLFASLRIWLIASGLGNAATPETVDFNRDIQPILSDNCYHCHGPDEHARKAKLRLDRKEGAYGRNEDGR